MKKSLLLTSVGVLFLAISGIAQANIDSLAAVAKISDYNLQLGKLQNQVAQKSNTKQNDAMVAQQSANANSVAANTLQANPQDKGDAKEASHTASNAKGDGKKARKSSDSLDDLNKNIQDLQGKIASEQKVLDKFTHVVYVPAMTAVPAPSPRPDSTNLR